MPKPDDDELAQMRFMALHYKRKLLIVAESDLPPNSKLPGPPPTGIFLNAIRTEGLHSPIEIAANPDGSWEVLDGNRRLKAARALHWPKLEALQILGLDDPGERMRWKIAANKYRSDNPMQVALMIAELAKAGKTEAEIAAELRLTTPEIRRLGPLSGLPKPIARGLHEGTVALGTALAVVKMPRGRQEQLSAKLVESRTLTGQDVKEARQVDVTANVAALDLGPMEFEVPVVLYVMLENGRIVAGSHIPLGEAELAQQRTIHPNAQPYMLVRL